MEGSEFGLSPAQFDALQPGDQVWFRTGNFTASLAKVLSKSGNGATRCLWLDVIHRAPGQPSTATLNQGKGLPVSYRSVLLT